MIDVFHDIDKKILDKYNIPRRFDTREEIENIQKNILAKKVIRDIAVKTQKLTNETKRLREENKLRNTTPETLNENKQNIKENINKWNALEHLTNQIEKIKGKFNSILNLMYHHHHKKGSGFLQPKRQSYKLTKDGRYGDLTIDIAQLFAFNRLIAMKDSKVVFNQMVDHDFIELITNRYNSRKTYSTKFGKLNLGI